MSDPNPGGPQGGSAVCRIPRQLDAACSRPRFSPSAACKPAAPAPDPDACSSPQEAAETMRASQQLLFRLTQAVETVKKTTGGKAWQKPWGFNGFTKTQTRNRQKQIRQEQGVMDALRQAAENQAAAAKPLP